MGRVRARKADAIKSGPTRAYVRVEDPQQFPFYRLEREEIGARDYARLRWKDAERVIRSVCRAYSVPRAQLKKRVMGRWAAEYDSPGQYFDLKKQRFVVDRGPGTINVNPRKGTAMDLLTLLHELAHHVQWHLHPDGGTEQEPHGPQFVSCYVSILDTVRLIPRDAMIQILRRRKIRYINPGPTLESLKVAIL